MISIGKFIGSGRQQVGEFFAIIMPKKDHTKNDPVDLKAKSPVTTQSVVSKTTKPTEITSDLAKNATKRTRNRNRKVKFAEPLTEQRLFEKAVSPSAVSSHNTVNTDTVTNRQLAATSGGKQVGKTTLADYEPPFSLIAQLDLAAHKLHVRNEPGRKEPAQAEDVEQRLEPMKSLKSVKSTKSHHETKNVKEK